MWTYEDIVDNGKVWGQRSFWIANAVNGERILGSVMNKEYIAVFTNGYLTGNYGDREGGKTTP